MPEEILKLLIQFGGGTAVIVALVYFLKALREFLPVRKNRIDEMERTIVKLKDNEMHELSENLRELTEEFYCFRQRTSERLTRIETILKMKGINNSNNK